MLEALLSRESSDKEVYRLLIEETKFTCIPKLICTHEFCVKEDKKACQYTAKEDKIYRHCNHKGHLIHIQVSLALIRQRVVIQYIVVVIDIWAV